MSKRLQVLLEEKEYRQFAKTARSHSMSLCEWVRQSLRRSLQQASDKDPGEKMRKIHLLIDKLAYPVSDVKTMLSESVPRFKD